MENGNINLKTEDYVNSKCPNCGSELKFLPGTYLLKCISCDSEFNIESLGTGKLDEEEVDLAKTLELIKKSSVEDKIQRRIHCQDCGGLIILNERCISTTCPFCGSHRVVEDAKSQPIVKVNGVIRFAFGEDYVEQEFIKWIKKRPFAPKKLKSGIIKPSFSGYYIPFYTFDANTISNYTAYRGDYYYVTRTIHSKNGTRVVSERHTKWTYKYGTVNLNFDDVLINGTNNSLSNLVSKIDSFDFNKLEKFQEKFLLGYYSEMASLSLEDGFNSAKKIMVNKIRSHCINDIGGDTYKDLKFSTNFTDVTFKQIMAPIYNGHYMYKNKKYNFICNGQNGKFVGNNPISAIKVGILVFSIILLIVIIFILTTI